MYRPLVFLLLSYCVAACNSEVPKSPPNIILIMADDMGYGDPTIYNADSKIPTPNIDRIGHEGIRLMDAHSPSAVCTPTRYGVLTGRYAWRSSLKKGVLWGYSPNLIDSSLVTIPQILKTRGYDTAGIGKWHLGLGAADTTDYSRPLTPGPVDLGFDYYYGIPASLDMQPYVYFENDRVVEAPTAFVEASAHRRQEGGGFWRAGPVAPGFKHIDVLDDITDKAVRYIEDRSADSNTPFFLYFPLSAPHTPWLPTEPFLGKSGAGYYGDFALQVDHTVGRVLNALDRLDLADNTLIIFTSDNGAHWYPEDIEAFDHKANLNLRGQKADIWEGGHRVPFLVRWPEHIPAGSSSHETTTHTDLLATLAAVAGTQRPEDAGEDSYNMLPDWLGHELERPVRPSTIHHSLDGMFAIRQGDWKLIEALGSGGFTQPARITPENGKPIGQLYNLKDDPTESNNLYQDRPDLVAKLQAALDAARSAS